MIWDTITQWIKHFVDMDASGTVVPPPPAQGGAPVSIPPVSSQPNQTLPAGVLAVNGNAVKLAAVEALRAAAPDPLCAKLAEWFIVQDASPNTLETRANLDTAKQLLIGNIGVTNPGRWNAQHFESAFHAVPDASPRGYAVGEQYPDVLSCIGDNIDANGNVIYRSPRVADFPTLLANCLADLSAARARNEPDVRLEGYLPIIDHSNRGTVAHM